MMSELIKVFWDGFVGSITIFLAFLAFLGGLMVLALFLAPLAIVFYLLGRMF